MPSGYRSNLVGTLMTQAFRVLEVLFVIIQTLLHNSVTLLLPILQIKLVNLVKIDKAAKSNA